MQRRHPRSFALVALVFVALGFASCGDDDDSAATTTSTSTTTSTTTTTLPPEQIAPTELRGRWIGMAGADRITLTLADGSYQISIAGAGARFRPKVEYEGDTIRFLTTVDNCDQLAVYRWQVDGDTLTLTPVGDDQCANRRFFLGAGTFTREGASTTTTG